MNRFQATFMCVLAAAFGGCSWFGWGRGDGGGSPVSETFAKQSDIKAQESRTLSGLATLESSLHDYIKGEGKIPEKIEDMIPKYLAEVPLTELGVSKHSDSSNVQRYPSGVIRDGVIDGAQLKDTGYWGYAHNDRQVIIFVDCTHTNSRGKPWFKERGVF